MPCGNLDGEEYDEQKSKKFLDKINNYYKECKAGSDPVLEFIIQEGHLYDLFPRDKLFGWGQIYEVIKELEEELEQNRGSHVFGREIEGQNNFVFAASIKDVLFSTKVYYLGKISKTGPVFILDKSDKINRKSLYINTGGLYVRLSSPSGLVKDQKKSGLCLESGNPPLAKHNIIIDEDYNGRYNEIVGKMMPFLNKKIKSM